MITELTTDEIIEVEGGFILTLIAGASYCLVQIGGITILKFVGAAAVAGAIPWAVGKGLDYVFG